MQPASQPHDDDERQVRALYAAMHDTWNQRDAGALAALYTTGGHSIGFDGSMMSGAAEIESTIGAIFEHHQTARYIGIIRSVGFPKADTALLIAVVGMVPPGASDIKPEVNAVQTMLAVKDGGTWRIELFQNTPAAFHGRPELAEELSDELRRALRESSDGTTAGGSEGHPGQHH